MTKGVRLRQEPGWGAGHHGCNVALHTPHPLQAVNPGRSLFLLYALKSSPRLGLLYLYLFDYTDTFLPFIHTICPLQEDSSGEDIITKLLVGLQGALNRSISPFLVVFNYRYSGLSLSRLQVVPSLPGAGLSPTQATRERIEEGGTPKENSEEVSRRGWLPAGRSNGTPCQQACH